ncbi:response regulator [Acidithiobacillus ferriphilus]|uniref:response regulator n=1 Tax=Acidithiobacillus ferriphilus TaxID=1689834 RepID=UPI00390C8318
MPERILIVEDNMINYKLAGIVLRKAGYEILHAGDAEQGIVIARAEYPDLVLMDIHLPGMDGLTAIRILKEDPATRRIPIIALTALAMKGDEESIFAAGCDAYLSKPIGHQTLIEVVGRFL